MTLWLKLIRDCCGRITDSRVSSWIVAGIRIGRRDLRNRGTYNKRCASATIKFRRISCHLFVIRITDAASQRSGSRDSLVDPLNR